MRPIIITTTEHIVRYVVTCPRFVYDQWLFSILRNIFSSSSLHFDTSIYIWRLAVKFWTSFGDLQAPKA